MKKRQYFPRALSRIDERCKNNNHHSDMGIPYLTKHLLPHAETVFLGGDVEVVIDGPSLVYHIHRRLLGWMDPNCDILDYQPSCDEISRGVGNFLLELTRLRVKM